MVYTVIDNYYNVKKEESILCTNIVDTYLMWLLEIFLLVL